jgi:glycosyltransferase involved in cell wall biosynthesis
MRIGINLSPLTPSSAGGMEWYARCVIRELSRIDRENEYLLVTGPNSHASFPPPGPNWKRALYRGYENVLPNSWGSSGGGPPRPLWYRALRKLYRRYRHPFTRGWSGPFGDLIRAHKLDLWFCPFMYALPFDVDVPVVTTMADLQQEYFPEFFHANHELTRRQLGYQYSCKVSAATIAISHAVARDIVELYGIDPARVFAIPLALDPFIESALPQIERYVAAVRLKFRLGAGRYIFFPANGWPHKNHEAVVRAMRRVSREAPGVKLLLTGCPFLLLERLKPILDEYNLHDVVHHLGYVSRADVVGLYALSQMLVFPSLFEGFGLPLLEAMYLGAPVACSGLDSLREVGGDAAHFFDPLNDEAIAEAILDVLLNEPLRRRLIAAGKEQVTRFSYTETAQATLEVFRQVHAGRLTRPGLPPVRPLQCRDLPVPGGCRWYFRQQGLQALKLEVIQRQPPRATTGQQLVVVLDGKRVLTAPLEPLRACQFVVELGHSPGDNHFHTLELTTSNPRFFDLEPLPVEVISVVAYDSFRQELRLVA